MKLIAFGASYSNDSINQKFATYAAKQFAGADIEILDLRNYWLPLYTTDVETEIGHPEEVTHFLAKLEQADLIVISLAEYNGSYATAFKNLFDWASRVKMNFFEGKELLLLSTSPGPRGGLTVLQTAKERFPFHGATIAGTFSLPNFYDNFSEETGILNEEIKGKFNDVIGTLQQAQTSNKQIAV